MAISHLMRSLTKGFLIVGMLAIEGTPSARAAGIFWSELGGPGDEIQRANLDGTYAGSIIIVPSGTPSKVDGLAVDGTRVYWTNDRTNTIGRANLDFTEMNNSFLTGLTPADVHFGIAIEGNYIYWVNRVSGTIGRANLDGTGVSNSFLTGANHPFGLAVDGDYIYWANNASGTIGRANLDGTGVNESFITGASAPWGVAIEGNYIYWANAGTATIARANLSGTGVNLSFIKVPSPNPPLPPGVELFPAGVAVDGHYIYWTTPNTNEISRANLDGTGLNGSFIIETITPSGIAVVPEPATSLLVMAGVLGLAVARRRAGVSG